MEKNKYETTHNDNRQCFAYVRVSTAHQTGGLESQIHAVQNFCKQNEIKNYRIFQDENVSGAKASRPALDAMMNDIRENKCKMLIVFSFSRFSRSCTHLLQSLEVLKKHNVQFVSVSEKIDTNSPIGSALLAIIGALAQLERDLIRERILSGLERAKKNGIRLGRLKTRPSELIRKLYLSRLPYKEIARVCKCSEGCVGVEANLLKLELGEEKVKELRKRSGRRGIIAYKPEVNFTNNNDKGTPEEKPIVPIAEISA